MQIQMPTEAIKVEHHATVFSWLSLCLLNAMDAKTRCTIFVTKHLLGANMTMISNFIALQSAGNKQEPRPRKLNVTKKVIDNS